MVEERATTQEDIDLLSMEGRDDGFNLAPIETARLLHMGRNSSMTATSYFASGELIAISGVYAESLLAAESHVWMVASHAVKRHQIAFLRAARRTLEALPWPLVTCFCDPTFQATCRWLDRLGFKEMGTAVIKDRPFLLLGKSR